jgi:transcriptional regulator with XRE-family HTH domain
MPEPERHVRTLCSAAGFAHVAGAAAAAGVERRTLLWAMRGQRKPRRKVVARLASVLGVATELLAAIFEKARSERGARS